MKKPSALLFLTIALLTGCATEPKIATTASGLPEVTIDTGNMDAVKAAIISRVAPFGYTLRSDSNYRLVFAKQMSGMGAVLTQVAIGNSYSTTPEQSISFTMFKVKHSVRVLASGDVSTQMAFGQVRNAEISGGSRWFNDVERILYAVKQDVEQAESAEVPTSSSTSTELKPIHYPGGGTYVGEIRNNLRDGSGTYTSPDGTKYTGDWRNGKRDGQGTVIWSNGDKYTGEWREDHRDGFGVLTRLNGKIENGVWRNDVLAEPEKGEASTSSPSSK